MNFLVRNYWGDYNNIDIILWTVGIFLSLFSVVFGLIAAIQSSKSTRELKEITKKMHILNTFRTDLYTNVINIIKLNDDIIARLESDYYKSYNLYRLDSRNTRLQLIQSDIIKESSNTMYEKVIKIYIETENWSDKTFLTLFPFELIRSNSAIKHEHLEKLISYHKEYMKRLIKITNEYTEVNSKNN